MCFNPSNYTLSYAKFYEDFENGTENFLLYCYDVIMTSFVIDVFCHFEPFSHKMSLFQPKNFTSTTFLWLLLWFLSIFWVFDGAG